MSNVNPETGIRYGVISMNSLDPDLADDLWFGPDATNVSYDYAYAEAKAEEEGKYEAHLEEAEIAANETDPNMSEEDFETFIENWFEERDIEYCKELFVDRALDQFSDCCQIDEPTIEGIYDGVEYQITWLGGAPLLWVLKGPEGNARQLCSPCVPNAANLDDGFVLDSELETDPECNAVGVSREDHENGFPCYCVPRDWLFKEEN